MAESSDRRIEDKEYDVDLTDCLLHHMDISVSESEKRTTPALNIRDCYTVYLVETRITDNSWEITEHGLGQIWRRYSEFEQLRHYLCSTYPWAVVPPLPEKKHSFPVLGNSNDTFDPDFIDRRRAALETFLHRIASHPIVSKDSMFLMFLQEEEGWRNSIKDIGYVQLAEDKFKCLSAGVRVKHSDPEFEQIRKYSRAVQGSLSNLLRIRSRAALRIYNVHKLSSGYGKVFSEWSAIEKEMGDSLQRIGHFFDSIASGSETFLEEEEHIIDQLKEYLHFASSLEDLCGKRDVLQLELEQNRESLKSKRSEKEKILQGKSSLVSRLLGSIDSEETKNMRLTSVEQKIHEGQESIFQNEEVLRDFKTKALADVESFQKRKVADLTETLEDFIKLQIKMARKGLQTWSNIKDCINSIPT
ncbi:sorting nexin-4 [Halyomorpha halys]|uniref:sorting nexin-4 n=1 Tax=Halyomorpha halys TaxID=286706 RepID=UPI0006D4F9B4|nr:sorting nexin-4 [Halyomorpha halys]